MIEAHGGYGMVTLALAGAAALVWLAMYWSTRRPLRALDATNESLKREVAARQEAEEKLLRLLESERLASGARLRSFFEAAPQAVLAVTPEGDIMLVNRQIEQIFGYRRDELLGQKLAVLLPERFRDVHAGHRERFFQTPVLRPMGSGRSLFARRKDGSEFPVEVGLNSLETDQGTFALATVIDITERMRAENEVSRVNEELRRSNAELEQFTYVASHDLQEPLRMVSNYLQLLEKRAAAKLNQEEVEFVHFALDGASRMKALIQDLLRLSRAGTQELKIGPVPLEMAVEGAKLNLSAAIEESGALVEYGDLPVLEADAGLMVQVLQNLVGNGIKFRKAGVAPHIVIEGQARRDEWLITVQDNGIGIEPVYKDRVFQMFERLHASEAYTGSGVGLAIVQRIVERHGGRIWVESEAGEGAAFYFTLPKKTAAHAPPSLAASN